ncbi:MAG: VanW family protein [Clostridiales bacterium]|nr:VanW family protein [Clostridiales bacterium]
MKKAKKILALWLCTALALRVPVSAQAAVTLESAGIADGALIKTLGADTEITQLALYTTRFSTSDANRNHNMEMGANKNNVVVKSGASFSFNTNTGDSTRTANGWRESIVLVNTKRVRGVGGGLCQCSSTIYSAVKQAAGLTILERNPHSVPVGYVPVSGEAMVNYGTSDFRFRNDNPYDIFVYTTIDHGSGSLTASVYKINAERRKARVLVNGQEISAAAAPRIIDGRVYVEMRTLFESLGYTVTYDAGTKAVQAQKGGLAFLLEKGADSQNILRRQDGTITPLPMQYPAFNVSDRIIFSLRRAGDLLGYETGWDAETKTASLQSR